MSKKSKHVADGDLCNETKDVTRSDARTSSVSETGRETASDAPWRCPPLGISPKVRGGTNEGQRVRYLEGGKMLIPEEVVLGRWRRRAVSKGVRSHHGCRLPPNIWGLIGAIEPWLDFPDHERSDTTDSSKEVGRSRVPGTYSAAQGPQFTRESIESALAHAVESGVALPNGETPPTAIAALLNNLSGQAIRALIERHPCVNDPYGVPDLLLYQVTRKGRNTSVYFVEVKRPDEALKTNQKEEIDFLRSLNLRAGVFRLRESSA